MKKAFAIFDMDGTLVDSMQYWKQLGREYIRGKGVTGEIDSVLQQTKPLTMAESSALFIREFHLKGTPEEIAAEMTAVMDDHYRHDVPLKPGVRAYLSKLKQRGVTMCVASATAEPLVKLCLTRLGVADHFSFLLSCERVGVGKNSPDVYLEAARQLGCAPQEAAVFEDALYAAETAKKAGFYTVGIYDDNSRDHWPRMQALADQCITDWAEAAEDL